MSDIRTRDMPQRLLTESCGLRKKDCLLMKYAAQSVMGIRYRFIWQKNSGLSMNLKPMNLYFIKRN